MDLLQQARAEIDTVDAEMAALFERRMRAVADVVRYKAETGKPVFDAAREAAVLDKNTARITDEALRPYYRAFLSDAMSISRAYPARPAGPRYRCLPRRARRVEPHCAAPPFSLCAGDGLHHLGRGL